LWHWSKERETRNWTQFGGLENKVFKRQKVEVDVHEIRGFAKESGNYFE